MLDQWRASRHDVIVGKTSSPEALAELEQTAAAAAGERRGLLGLSLVGTVLVLWVAAPRTFPRREGGEIVVRSFKAWWPRGAGSWIWCDVREPVHLALVAGLLEGERVRVSGVLNISERAPGRTFVSLRIAEMERA